MIYATDNRYSPGASGASEPDGAPAAYSARWIDNGQRAQILPDRQGFAYDTMADRDSLIEHLSDAKLHANLPAALGYDQSVRVVDNTWWVAYMRRAGGYVYVDAWLTPVPQFSDLDLSVEDVTEGEQQYEVTVSNYFGTTSPEDAVRQMVAWLVDQAHAAGYRVNRYEDDAASEPVETWHIDADDLDLGAPIQDAWDVKLLRPVPGDWPVQPLAVGAPMTEDVATCGECGRSWDDGVSTSMTPAPSGRCPFEYFHDALDACVHCGQAVERDEHGTLVDATGGDVCGSWGTFTNEPHVIA